MKTKVNPVSDYNGASVKLRDKLLKKQLCTVSFPLTKVAMLPITQLVVSNRFLPEDLLVLKLMKTIDRSVLQLLPSLLVLPWLGFFPDHLLASLQRTRVLTGIDVL